MPQKTEEEEKMYTPENVLSFHSPVVLHHVRMVSSISSLESGRLQIFFRERRWQSDSRSLLAESKMALTSVTVSILTCMVVSPCLSLSRFTMVYSLCALTLVFLSLVLSSRLFSSGLMRLASMEGVSSSLNTHHRTLSDTSRICVTMRWLTPPPPSVLRLCLIRKPIARIPLVAMGIWRKRGRSHNWRWLGWSRSQCRSIPPRTASQERTSLRWTWPDCGRDEPSSPRRKHPLQEDKQLRVAVTHSSAPPPTGRHSSPTQPAEAIRAEKQAANSHKHSPLLLPSYLIMSQHAEQRGGDVFADLWVHLRAGALDHKPQRLQHLWMDTSWPSASAARSLTARLESCRAFRKANLSPRILMRGPVMLITDGFRASGDVSLMMPPRALAASSFCSGVPVRIPSLRTGRMQPVLSPW
ncbi:hypothetical protein F7725_012307 [Dissostichus mawsoni]|uniref:Uncharacterized protein n=1 Tax=Dissostichus mawsoni TaxID=36200 RepID=A0A7J5YMB4_DISMA|nr:hypothetical protein F7725_012307 [Dissostichus mawsoni]